MSFHYHCGQDVRVGDRVVTAGTGRSGIVKRVIPPGSDDCQDYTCPAGGVLIEENRDNLTRLVLWTPPDGAGWPALVLVTRGVEPDPLPTAADLRRRRRRQWAVALVALVLASLWFWWRTDLGRRPFYWDQDRVYLLVALAMAAVCLVGAALVEYARAVLQYHRAVADGVAHAVHPLARLWAGMQRRLRPRNLAIGTVLLVTLTIATVRVVRVIGCVRLVAENDLANFTYTELTLSEQAAAAPGVPVDFGPVVVKIDPAGVQCVRPGGAYPRNVRMEFLDGILEIAVDPNAPVTHYEVEHAALPMQIRSVPYPEYDFDDELRALNLAPVPWRKLLFLPWSDFNAYVRLLRRKSELVNDDVVVFDQYPLRLIIDWCDWGGNRVDYSGFGPLPDGSLLHVSFDCPYEADRMTVYARLSYYLSRVRVKTADTEWSGSGIKAMPVEAFQARYGISACEDDQMAAGRMPEAATCEGHDDQ